MQPKQCQKHCAKHEQQGADYCSWYGQNKKGMTDWTLRLKQLVGVPSYFDSAYPWMRLGYTYDWADNDTEYGMTEFWMKPGAEVLVEYADTIDEFIERLEGGGAT